jgi:hypothetical protein
MQQNVVIKYQVFRKNSDNSWEATQNTDIEIPIGSVRIPRGMVFRPGMTFYGVDITGLLDQNAASASISR